MKNEKPERKPGETGFTLFLLVSSAFFTVESLQLMQRKPGLDGPATVPLIASGVVFVTALAEFVRLVTKTRTGDKRLRSVMGFLLPDGVPAALISVVAYCVLLMLGVSFWVVTPVFLMGLMTWLEPKAWGRNLCWTAVCMVFVFVVFKLVFHVVPG